MGLLIGIAFGIAAGAAAKPLTPGPDAGGMAMAIPLGAAGAILGGTAAAFRSGGISTGFDLDTLLLSVVGVLFVLFGYGYVARRGAR
ncbi:MAG: GlsB/YeaQ/YmgE family stress response membrane protein [Pirellulales bacterium]|nr:GlsB/YeaQ/YmgE family stress response membrane protein [Pirellulales bacterium]